MLTLTWRGPVRVHSGSLQETQVFNVGYGQSLIVKTETGTLHVLRREEVR
jgi:hypothetical protein